MPKTTEALLTRRQTLTPSTVNPEARTLRVTASTGAPVQRRDLEGPFLEALSLDPAHVRLDRLKGAPVLDSHRQDALSDVLGTVTDAGIDGGGLWAEIKVSARRGDVMTDIQDGIIRAVSIGYRVHQWKEQRSQNSRTKTGVDWEPLEVSFVPLPADAGATVRSNPQMPEEIQPPEAATPATRAAVNAEIRSIAATVGLGDNFANGLIDRNATADQARAAAFEALRANGGGIIRTESPITIGRDFDTPEIRAGWMGEALYSRVNPTHEPTEAARQYVGLTLPEMGREILRLRGIPTTGMSADTVITRALHTTSDFATILGDTVGRTLRQAYQAAPSGVRRLGRQSNARDFRAKHRLQLSEAPTLEKVGEHGEYKSGTLAETSESYAIDTFGRIIGISRKALVNDDLGAFTDLSRRFGTAAAEFEAQFLVDLLTANAGAGPTMSDGKALFHADHANLAGTGAALDQDNLSAARLAMRTQKGLSGKPIDVTPKYLLVPAALETAAEKLLAAITPTTSADVNPHAGKLDLVVDSRLDAVSATRWYIAADPATIDGLEYAYLEGAPGPQIESRNGFEIDGVQVKVRLDFGGGFVDWRGWHANAGA